MYTDRFQIPSQKFSMHTNKQKIKLLCTNHNQLYKRPKWSPHQYMDDILGQKKIIVYRTTIIQLHEQESKYAQVYIN